MQITRAITHIRLLDTNAAKLTTLDTLAQEYMALCQQYVIAFCTDHDPDKYAKPLFPSILSARWQQAAIQQAAGLAQSWRSNRDRCYTAYQEDLTEYQAHSAEHLPPLLPDGCQVRVRRVAGETDVTYPDGTTATYRHEPHWKE
ncbi:MAG TPA: hypothetical protein VKY74_14685, partial [Chloroflexia bacterium]|nr:hypothetical protein [Chloroflexia bacterium]